MAKVDSTSYAEGWMWVKRNPVLLPELLRELELEAWLPSMSSSLQVEVLTNAPDNVLRCYSDLIKAEAKVKLGMEAEVVKWNYKSLC